MRTEFIPYLRPNINLEDEIASLDKMEGLARGFKSLRLAILCRVWWPRQRSAYKKIIDI